MVDLFFLKTFVSAARSKSFKTAAERNFITQPAVSQQMRALEKKLGGKLFQRQGKNIVLTSAGEILLPYAENILHQYTEAQSRIQKMESHYIGTIRTATIYSIGLYDLQPLVRRYLSKHPQVTIQLEYNQSRRIYEMVQNQRIDFGFVAYPKEMPGVQSTVFHNHKLVCVQSPHKRVFSKKTVTLKDLNEQPYITFSAKVPTGKAIDNFLKTKNINPRYIQDYENIETLKSAVLIGMGFSIVPKATIQHELKNGDLEIVNVNKLDIERPLAVLMAKDKVLTKAMKGFLSLITKKSI
ncbi:MAG: LysR family transcriptional regulator [Candidatus Omnitrophica bacterium]|nr:LysR family transcriptional regulator [Candidatus Omnitrophota bacterium]